MPDEKSIPGVDLARKEDQTGILVMAPGVGVIARIQIERGAPIQALADLFAKLVVEEKLRRDNGIPAVTPRSYYPWNMPQADDCGECGCRKSGHHGAGIGCEGAGGTCRCPGYRPRGQAETERLIAAANVYDARRQLVKPAGETRPRPGEVGSPLQARQSGLWFCNLCKTDVPDPTMHDRTHPVEAIPSVPSVPPLSLRPDGCTCEAGMNELDQVVYAAPKEGCPIHGFTGFDPANPGNTLLARVVTAQEDLGDLASDRTFKSNAPAAGAYRSAFSLVGAALHGNIRPEEMAKEDPPPPEPTPIAMIQYVASFLERGRFNTYGIHLRKAIEDLVRADQQFRERAAAEVTEIRKGLEDLKEALNRDQTGLARGLELVLQEVRGYAWIPAGEWGSYDYTQQNEGTLRDEIGRCFDAVTSIAKTTLQQSGTLATKVIQGEGIPLLPDVATAAYILRLKDGIDRLISAGSDGSIHDWRREVEFVRKVRDQQTVADPAKDAPRAAPPEEVIILLKEIETLADEDKAEEEHGDMSTANRFNAIESRAIRARKTLAPEGE